MTKSEHNATDWLIGIGASLACLTGYLFLPDGGGPILWALGVVGALVLVVKVSVLLVSLFLDKKDPEKMDDGLVDHLLAYAEKQPSDVAHLMRCAADKIEHLQADLNLSEGWGKTAGKVLDAMDRQGYKFDINTFEIIPPTPPIHEER